MARAKKQPEQPERSREPVVSDWAGHERFACPMPGCAFDTLNRGAFDEHMTWDHPLPAADETIEGDADGATDAH